MKHYIDKEIEERTMTWAQFRESFSIKDDDETEVSYEADLHASYADYIRVTMEETNTIPTQYMLRKINKYYLLALHYNPQNIDALISYAYFLEEFLKRDKKALQVLKKAIDLSHQVNVVYTKDQTLHHLLYNCYVSYSRLLAKNPKTQKEALEYRYKALGLDPGTALSPDYKLFVAEEADEETEENLS